MPPNRPDIAALQQLADTLPSMTPEQRAAELAYIGQDAREHLASSHQFVDKMSAELPSEEFAKVAAQLIVRVPEAVDQPVSARHEAEAQISRMLQDPIVAARMLKNGNRVVVVPKDVPMTSIAEFSHMRNKMTTDNRLWSEVRGSGGFLAAITEENLLGEKTTVGAQPWPYPDGYSTTTHEFAHTIHWHGLEPEARQLITMAFQRKHKQAQNDPTVQWPDGPPYHAQTQQPMWSYGATSDFEYFAQVSNAYLSTNTGNDPNTKQPRNNGREWVEQHEPYLLPLLERLYGTNPQAIHSTRANPFTAKQAENDLHAGYRAFMVNVGARSASSSPSESPALNPQQLQGDPASAPPPPPPLPANSTVSSAASLKAPGFTPGTTSNVTSTQRPPAVTTAEQAPTPTR